MEQFSKSRRLSRHRFGGQFFIPCAPLYNRELDRTNCASAVGDNACFHRFLWWFVIDERLALFEDRGACMTHNTGEYFRLNPYRLVESFLPMKLDELEKSMNWRIFIDKKKIKQKNDRVKNKSKTRTINYLQAVGYHFGLVNPIVIVETLRIKPLGATRSSGHFVKSAGSALQKMRNIVLQTTRHRA